MLIRGFPGTSCLQKFLPWLRLSLAITLAAGIATVLSCLRTPEVPEQTVIDQGQGFVLPSIKGKLSDRALTKPGYFHNQILIAIDRIRPLRGEHRISASDLAAVFAKAANRVFEEEGEAVRLEPEDALLFFEFFHRLAHEGAYDILHSDLSSSRSLAEFVYLKGYFSRAQADSLAMFLSEISRSATDPLSPAAPGSTTSLLKWGRFAAHDIYNESKKFWNNYKGTRASRIGYSGQANRLSDAKKVILSDAAGSLLGLLGGAATAILGGAFASYVMQDYLEGG